MKYFPREYDQAKADLIESLTLIPANLYSNRFVSLLHPVCDVIISNQINRFPSIYKKVLHFEDAILDPLTNPDMKKLA